MSPIKIFFFLFVDLIVFQLGYSKSIIQVNNTIIELRSNQKYENILKQLNPDSVYSLIFQNINNIKEINLTKFDKLYSFEIIYEKQTSIKQIKIMFNAVTEVSFENIIFHNLELVDNDSMQMLNFFKCKINSIIQIDHSNKLEYLSITCCDFSKNGTIILAENTLNQLFFVLNNFFMIPKLVIEAPFLKYLDIYTDNSKNYLNYQLILRNKSLRFIKINPHNICQDEINEILAIMKDRGIKIL